MLCAVDNDANKKKVQSQVIQILNKTNYSLNVVNRYKENIVHISAANDCIDIIKCILQKHSKHSLERKNAFGWTPLMQAIRNENINMVKFLLSSGVIVNDFTFLGMSVLSLACAISNEMFDIVYESSPSALEYAAHDDINPLCVAALKNDKKLFFKLLHLGLDVQKANAFTHAMIKRSTIPEIAILAKSHLSSEDYWNDLSQIEDLLNEENSNNNVNIDTENIQLDNLKTGAYIPKICIGRTEQIMVKEVVYNYNKKNHLNIQTETNPKSSNLISPMLSYLDKSALLMSPNTFITEENLVNTFTKISLNVNEKLNAINNSDSNKSPTSRTGGSTSSISPLVLRRCQGKRPPNLKLRSSSNDSNVTLSFTPQFSPTKTPNLPHDIHEDNVFDETTPTPPKYKTPPRGIILDPNINRLMVLLQQFGLKRHIPTFLEQEVDMDLFLTLTDRDLVEIGIDSKSERLILLSVINECKGSVS